MRRTWLVLDPVHRRTPSAEFITVRVYRNRRGRPNTTTDAGNSINGVLEPHTSVGDLTCGGDRRNGLLIHAALVRVERRQARVGDEQVVGRVEPRVFCVERLRGERGKMRCGVRMKDSHDARGLER